MVLTYRFYRSPEIGTGIRGDAFRSKLTEYIPGGIAQQIFWDWSHPARVVRYGLAYCDSTVHSTINGDPTITALSAQLADRAAVETWLDEPISQVPQAIQDQFEADGFSVGWVTAQTTRRAVFRYIARVHVMTQDGRRLRDLDIIDFFKHALTLTVSQIPAPTRTKIATWMTNRGLDTSWVTGATTVRQVIQFVMTSIEWTILGFGSIRMD